jgi:hypothetical protein
MMGGCQVAVKAGSMKWGFRSNSSMDKWGYTRYEEGEGLLGPAIDVVVGCGVGKVVGVDEPIKGRNGS